MNWISLNRTFWKSIYQIFLPLYILMVGFLVYVSVLEINNLRDKNKIIRENLVKENQNIIKSSVNEILSDVCYLVEMPQIQGFYANPAQNIEQLKIHFGAFAKNKNYYYQIRLIDTLGYEKVRVDHTGDRVVIYDEENLQYKGHRYYFKRMLAIHNEQFYLSPMDLNVEHGEIETPHVPVLRIGKNIYDTLSGKRIMLIVNYKGSYMLSGLADSSLSGYTHSILLNAKGYFLKGTDPAKEWSFMFPDSTRGHFSTQFPTEWRELNQNKKSGQLKSKAGYFTFVRLNLLDYFFDMSSFAYPVLDSSNELILISYDDIQHVRENIYKPAYKKLGVLSGAGGVLLIIFTIFFSKIRQSQIDEKEQRKLQYLFMNSLIETIPNPMFYFDYMNNRFGCNEAFEKLTGKKRKELKNLQIEKLFNKDGKIKVYQSEKDTIKESELKLKYPDGEIHNLIFQKVSISSKKKKAGLVGVFTDITTIRQAEEALRESEQKLRLANRTKNKFFSIIAHDLKNPFHAILGLTQLLKTTYKELSEEDRNHIFENIHRSTENTYQLLLNLLDWARLHDGKIETKPQKINIGKLAADTLELYQPRIDEKNLNANCNIPLNYIAWADENMIHTVFRNLINNAIKFTEAGDNLTISAQQNKTHLKVSIADSGIGIREDILKSIFQIDKKNNVKSNNQEGTGLGLILCKEFIELNRGEIWAESEINTGSVFYFTLPNDAPDAEMPLTENN